MKLGRQSPFQYTFAYIEAVWFHSEKENKNEVINYMFKTLEEIFNMVVVLMLIPTVLYQYYLNNMALAFSLAILLRLYVDAYIRKEKRGN